VSKSFKQRRDEITRCTTPMPDTTLIFDILTAYYQRVQSITHGNNLCG